MKKMNRTEDIKTLKQELELRLKDIKSLTKTLGNLEATSSCDDIGVVTSSNEQNEVTTQLAYFESKHIIDIEYALQKISDGTYGTCEECEKDITIARLQALPTTIHCIKCKGIIEKLI